MSEHGSLPVGAETAHPPGYVQNTDPGAVGAYKPWWQTDSDVSPTAVLGFFIRDAANASWLDGFAAIVAVGAVSSVFGRSGAVIPTTGDYSLDLISGVTLTTPGAGDFLRHDGIEFVNSTIQAGDIPTTAVTPGTYGDASNIPSFTVDSTGRITAASQTPSSGGVSSFNTRTGAVVPATDDYAIADITGLSAALALLAPLASPSFTGTPTVPTVAGTSDSTTKAASTAFVQAVVAAAVAGAGASVTISTSAPGSPASGDLWWDSTYGTLKIYYDDGSSAQWVDASGSGLSSFNPTITTPSIDDVIKYAGGAWVNGPQPIPYINFPDAIDDPINDNFAGASIDTAGTRFTGAGAWVALNIGASVVTQSGRKLWIESPASASVQIRGYEQPVPSGNWCIRANFTFRNGLSTSEASVGMFLRDSVGGKCEVWAIGFTAGVGSIWAYKMTNSTTFSASRAATGVSSLQHPPFLEIEYDGTSYYLRFGYGGGSMSEQAGGLYHFAKTNFLAAVADRIGLFSENDQSIATTMVCGGFYRVPTSVRL